MAKTSRHARKKGKRRRPAIVPPVAPPTSSAAIPRPPVRQEAASQTAGATIQRGHTDFAAQYSYVRQDLRRIAFLASSILAVLIILSFVLR